MCCVVFSVFINSLAILYVFYRKFKIKCLSCEELISLRMVRGIQTAGSHLIVCNPVFGKRSCFTVLCPDHQSTDSSWRKGADRGPVLCPDHQSTDSSWRKGADRGPPLPQHSPGALISCTCSDELFSLFPAYLCNHMLFNGMPEIIDYRLLAARCGRGKVRPGKGLLSMR